MHQYLRAIGFGDIQTKRVERELLQEVEENFEYNQTIRLANEDYREYRKKFGENIGIVMCGEINQSEEFQREYHFPYLESKTVSSYADIIVDKRKDTESYMGICEDVRIGVNLIFYLQNPVEYMKELQDNTLSRKGSSVSLAALSLSGTVLFPIKKTPVMVQESKEQSKNRHKLLIAARKGDSLAVDSLAMEDIETYNKISKMILCNDVFSIVDTYFIPYGVECDEYSIMGEIKELRKVENECTGQELYHMVLEINEMYIELCVPKDGVLGEPEVGRRFKSVVWLQGKINFPQK
ncbi:MAG: DUF3881 family protein [Eubacteriales bacterium]